jgi:hypothetical protein
MYRYVFYIHIYINMIVHVYKCIYVYICTYTYLYINISNFVISGVIAEGVKVACDNK